MKNYKEQMALSKDERAADFKESASIADHMATAKSELGRHVAVTLVAMIKSGECASGKYKEKSLELTGKDIRETLQDVYGLTAVFLEIVDGTIGDFNEEDFYKFDSTKVARLSTFLGEKSRHLLPDALAKVKAGCTMKELQGIKPKVPGAKDKKIAELEAKAAEKEEREKQQGDRIPVGFVATDIDRDTALIHSGQFKARMASDMDRAVDSEDGETIKTMMTVFGAYFDWACDALGTDPLDILAQFAAEKAKEAKGTVIEAELIAVGA